MKKIENLQDLINIIIYDIIKREEDRLVQMNFDGDEALMFVFENEIPIKIKRHTVYDENFKPHKEIFAEVFCELFRGNIGVGDLADLDKICQLINENSYIFENLVK